MEQNALWKSTVARKLIAITLLIVLLTLSVTVLSKAASDPARYEKTLAALDEKEMTVLKMTGASAAAATAIAAVPGDSTTPVADELAELSSYFVIILTVIVVEKCLVAAIGHVSFAYLIPAACLLAIAGIVLEAGTFKRWALKVGIFGLVICILIPFCMGVSTLIEQTATYEETLEEAQQITEEISENTDDEGNFITKAWDKITGGITGLAKRGEDLFVDFLGSIAVLLATSCIIPVVVLLLAFWAIKMLFGVDVNLPAGLPKKMAGKFHKHGPTE